MTPTDVDRQQATDQKGLVELKIGAVYHKVHALSYVNIKLIKLLYN